MGWEAQAQVNIITTIAGVDSAGFCCDGELAINAALNTPFAICADKHNNIFFTDGFNNRIRKINQDGIITTIAGVDSGGYAGDSGLAINAALFLPEGIFIDSFDNIYIADAENSRIRKINALSGIITTIVGTGIQGGGGMAGSPSMPR